MLRTLGKILTYLLSTGLGLYAVVDGGQTQNVLRVLGDGFLIMGAVILSVWTLTDGERKER